MEIISKTVLLGTLVHAEVPVLLEHNIEYIAYEIYFPKNIII